MNYLFCPRMVKIMFLCLTGLFVFSGLTFSQQRKNELNTFAAFMVNSAMDGGVAVKGVDYNRWLNSYFSIGGGVISFGNVPVYNSWNINPGECYILNEETGLFLLSIQTQIQPCRVFLGKEHSIGLLIKPAMLVQLFALDLFTFEKYAQSNSSYPVFIDSEKRSYSSGSRVYFDGSIMITYKFGSLGGINIGYRISNVDIYKNLRGRRFGSMQFDTFLPEPELLKGGEIGLSFYF
ncbi:MAG: hypothetical protein LBB73_05445 [Dysgonamonadaceae bacterium]|nr:hypothetical protein [Dysgonamonadaceae bacterium]